MPMSRWHSALWARTTSSSTVFNTFRPSLSRRCTSWRGLRTLPAVDDYSRARLRYSIELKQGFRLLLSILKEPQLGRQLQEIVLDRTSSLDWRGEHGYKIQPTKAVVTADDLRRLQQAIRNIGIEDWDEQARFLNMVLQDFNYFELCDAGLFYRAQALAALLISVGQVEKLAFGPYGEHFPGKEFGFHHYLRRMAASREPTALQNLRHVRFLPDSDSIYEDTRFYSEYDIYGCLNLVRKLPSIESLRFDAMTLGEEPGIWPPPRSANYIDIMLSHCAIPEVDLGIIIRSAKNLKRFTYTVGGRHEMEDTPVFTRPLLESLLVHHHTLEYLDLDIESHASDLEMFDESSIELYPTEDYEQEGYEAHGADELAELASQEQQRPPTPPSAIIGARVLYCYARGFGAGVTEPFSLVDHLPPSLESLRIYGYGSDDGEGLYFSPDIGLNAQIAQLQEEKEQKLPSLSVIEGLDTPIPNGRNTYNPDDDEEELAWHRKDDEWVQDDDS
ncbi:hypothetical protein BDV33DRAFT_201923 [Aspergillus novoparasiticus]|uniref:Uncharacterized protein n=1 Tax=Aspergillus novoparasiticus TaxID=986946 RepID=A0A5N6EWF0_9EURO|nr:hypothetical protein BDV33DRAFT_201923 [Aspergillus novoparasiticus]